MIVKTSDLSGVALDWAVASCEGEASIVNGEPWIVTGTFFGVQQRPFNPSTKWAQGGPIIEREKISVWETCLDANYQPWSAITGMKTWGEEEDVGRNEFFGPTPLIAAMRCYVASNLGDTVDIPEELCE